MRIIAGKHRGMALSTLSGEDTRPTADRVKEAVFSSLMMALPNAEVLDLFAGSGALGLESLSRGASHADFVEYSKDAFRIVTENVKKANETGQASLYQMDFLHFLTETTRTYDLIFLDPPYAGGLYRPAIDAIIRRKLLRPGGQMIAEWDGKIGVPDFGDGIAVVKEKKYGRIHISFIKVADDNENCGLSGEL